MALGVLQYINEGTILARLYPCTSMNELLNARLSWIAAFKGGMVSLWGFCAYALRNTIIEKQKTAIFFIYALNLPKVANYYPNFTFFYKYFFCNL